MPRRHGDAEGPDTCQCVAGPVNVDGGCPTCHLLVLTLADDRARIDYLRARTVT